MAQLTDANAITAEYLSDHDHCVALSNLALSIEDLGLALFLQRLLATVAPLYEEFESEPTADQDQAPRQQ